MPQVQIETFREALTDGAAPAFGLAEGTSVLTLDGALPVEYLTPGDRILTRSGVRRLKAVEMTRLAHARMVRISADVLGTGKPEAEVLVVAGQPLLLRDWRAKALYGAAQVLVPAVRLVDGEYIRAEVMRDLRVFTLKLDGAGVIYAGGLELACEADTVDA
jgi:hypothetical protein